jgi:hypothetical protein
MMLVGPLEVETPRIFVAIDRMERPRITGAFLLAR